MEQTLNYIFNITIIIGFIIPLLNLLTGWFGNFFGVGFDMDAGASVDAGVDADLDAGVETGVKGGAIIPFNVMCLCLFLVVFGALGHIAKGFMSSLLLVVLLLAACLILAGLAYWALYVLLVKRLKNSDSSALSYQDLHGKTAEVTLAITADSMGTVSLKDSTGAPISFRAKMDPDLKDQLPDTIAKGESVIITDIDLEHKLCHVSLPFSKFSKDS